jgi:hypothetical protein
MLLLAKKFGEEMCQDAVLLWVLRHVWCRRREEIHQDAVLLRVLEAQGTNGVHNNDLANTKYQMLVALVYLREFK